LLTLPKPITPKRPIAESPTSAHKSGLQSYYFFIVYCHYDIKKSKNACPALSGGCVLVLFEHLTHKGH
jgi:hypothetical protein